MNTVAPNTTAPADAAPTTVSEASDIRSREAGWLKLWSDRTAAGVARFWAAAAEDRRKAGVGG